MSYALSILALAVVCIAWYGVQRLAGGPPPTCGRGDCDGCEAAGAGDGSRCDGSDPDPAPPA